MLAQGFMPLIAELQTKQYYDVMADWDRTTNTTSPKLIAWLRDQEKQRPIIIDPLYIEPWFAETQEAGPVKVPFLHYIRPFLPERYMGPVKLLHFSLVCYTWNPQTHGRPAYLDIHNRYIQLNYRIRPCPASLMSKQTDPDLKYCHSTDTRNTAGFALVAPNITCIYRHKYEP